MNPRQYGIGFLSILILFATITLSSTAYAETIDLSLKVGSCKIIRDKRGFELIEMDKFRVQASPGNPMLPERLYNILLPPDVVWASLKLRIINVEKESLPGTYDIGPGTPDSTRIRDRLIEDWGGAKNIENGKNMDIYGADAYFPQDYLKLEPYSQMRKWKFTKIRFTPVQYNPVTKKIDLIKNVRVEISFTRSSDNLDETLLRDKALDNMVPGMFFNYESARGWYLSRVSGDEAGQTNYVIITTNAIESNSTKLASFVTHKQNHGHSIMVITEDDFGGLTGQAPDHRAEKIRQWLINNYISYGIKYVLMIGDPHPYESGEGDIPMKMCWPLGTGVGDDSPTDCFYADLTGNWNLDGDQYYGEWGDYTGVGGVDFAVELWVGRIPVYSADYTTLNSILQKIMDYENETGASWRESILLPMGFQAAGYDGAPLGKQMKDDYLDVAGFSSWRMYQQGSGACSLNSSFSSEEELRGGTVVRDRWAGTDFGIVCWWAPGSSTSASVGYSGCWDGTLMNSDYTSSLDDDHPVFTYQCSSTNGYPENSGNLQYSILKQGGIGTVSATRASWFNTGVGYGEFDGSSTNSGIGYEYVDRLTQELPAGEALYSAKLAVVPDIGWRSTRLMNQYDFNLYGDPSTSIIGTVPIPTPTPTPTVTPTATPTPTPTPIPQTEIALNGSYLTHGSQFIVIFQLNQSIERPFTAFAVIFLPTGGVVDALRLSPNLRPAAINRPGLAAPFNYVLQNTVIPPGAPAGSYEVVVAFFDPAQPITGREDAFLEVSAFFTVQ